MTIVIAIISFIAGWVIGDRIKVKISKRNEDETGRR